MAKPFIESRVYMKPLFPNGQVIDKQHLERVVRMAKTAMLAQIKEQMTLTAFSPRAKVSLANALRVESKRSSILVLSSHPGMQAFLRGRRKQQMKWLLKASRPIPIITDTGKLIFRHATSRSMQAAGGGPNAGKPGWVHPGRTASDFLDKAKSKARALLKDTLQKELTKQLKGAVGSGKRRRK